MNDHRPGTADAIPAALQASFALHQTHLAELAGSLRQAHVTETLITDSIRVLVGSYERELIAAVNSILRNPGDV